MKITIKNISNRPQVLDLTKIISFKTVVSSEKSYSLNLREDKVTLINEYLKDSEIFKILENENKINTVKSEPEIETEKVIVESVPEITKSIEFIDNEPKMVTKSATEDIISVEELKEVKKNFKKTSKKKSNK